MTIYQPEDKTLTKERIEAILIVMNHMAHANPGPVEDKEMIYHLNLLLNEKGSPKGRFTDLDNGEIVFVAQ